MTAVAGATFTAAQFNQYIRDNLNAVCTALATTASQIPVSTGANAIAMRTPATATVTTTQTTTTTSYTDLATVGPAITATTGTIAIVLYAAGMANDVTDALTACSVAVSGASSVAANDQWGIWVDGVDANNFSRVGAAHVFTGLTAGSNTFTMKYKAGSNTASFQFREINVVPL
jgi:hypothetical protein